MRLASTVPRVERASF